MIQISDHFTYKRLLQYSVSPMIMMAFNSIYGVVDGLFMSNYAGKTAFAAVNFIWPFLMILGGVGFMFGTGGSALIARVYGEGKHQKANEIFSMLFYTSFVVGGAMMVLGYLLIRPVALVMGGEGQLLEDALLYGRIYILGVPTGIVQMEFQNLYATAEKPKLGLYATVASGVANIVLDALFVAGFRWGIAGAGVATVLSQGVGGVIPLLYFGRENSSLFHLVKTKYDGRSMGKICSNGASELLNNISMSLVGMLYNVQLLRYAGNDGVAAYGVIMYVDFLFLSLAIGYTVGVSPIISFNFGAQRYDELKSLLKKSVTILSVGSILMFLASELLARPVSFLFVGYDRELMDITLRGFFLYSLCFLFAGLSIFCSSFFTALNNGLVSALISFLRTVVFQTAAILVLPLIWKIDGIWLSVAAADAMALLIGLTFLFALRKKYHYM